LEGTSRGVGSVEGVVCYNPEEAERQKQHREQVRKELEAESDGLRTPLSDARRGMAVGADEVRA
jgi:hypothetical protein